MLVLFWRDGTASHGRVGFPVVSLGSSSSRWVGGARGGYERDGVRGETVRAASALSFTGGVLSTLQDINQIRSLQNDTIITIQIMYMV